VACFQDSHLRFRPFAVPFSYGKCLDRPLSSLVIEEGPFASCCITLYRREGAELQVSWTVPLRLT